jgi:hypothetical protein
MIRLPQHGVFDMGQSPPSTGNLLSAAPKGWASRALSGDSSAQEIKTPLKYR